MLDVPSTDDVKNIFAEAIRGIDYKLAELDPKEYDRIFSRLVQPNWRQAANGVKVIDVNDTGKLIRVTASFDIDPIAQGQEQQIHSRCAEIAEAIRSETRQGDVVRFCFESQPRTPAIGNGITCMAKGIIKAEDSAGQ
ncbi:hypothetical protein [Gimesia sp.]|uniref:hypothetical protein n=1 Tax=Gimesia sp. TaxID=2024833 RepID=UPI000C551422|nr:hypothetical protein [Gimesia sp.]MAX35800.1 hypothetical protein [Gimesia sp.]HAH48894.1 hypothetical protein [Planctomycetaceae bacterium]|tara:strand:+ start:18923 stop:19336 length:414 start_codon:yes stop_codon:yes gene_type:complete